MENNKTTPALKATKEVGRLIFITIVSYLLTEGVIALLVDTITGTRLDPMVKIQIVTFATFLIKAIDKWLHEKGKEEGKDGWLGTKGLTGF